MKRFLASLLSVFLAGCLSAQIYIPPNQIKPVTSGTVLGRSTAGSGGAEVLTFGGTTGEVTATFGSGLLTLSLPTALTFTGKTITGGTFVGGTFPAASTLTFGTHLTGTSYNGSAPVTIATDAASANTASTLVARDGSGNFSAGTITAGDVNVSAGITALTANLGSTLISQLAISTPLPSTSGGTGNGFTKFSGPTTSEKTFTLPNLSATLLYSGGPLGTPSSGTATNLTGTAAGLTAGNVTTNANLTGPVTSVGNATTITPVVTAGSVGSSMAIPVVTYNVAGQVTGTTTAAVVAPAGTLTGTTLASNVVSAPGLANVVQAEYFGADPTGAADSTAALKTAETYFAAIGGGTLVFKAGGSYKLSRYSVSDNGPSIRLVAGVNYEGNGAALLQTANAGFIGNVPDQTVRATITGNVAVGDVQLTVDTTAALIVGDTIGVRLGNNAYDAAETSLWFFSSVVSIDSGTTLHIDQGAPQAMVVGSTASANRAIVRFRAADNPVYQNQYIRNFKFVQSGAGNVEQGLSLVCTRNVTVENIYAENPGAGAVLMAYSFNNRVSNVFVSQSIQQSSQASKGRALNVWNSVDCTFRNIKADAFQGVAIFVESYCKNLLFDGVVVTNNWLAFAGTARGTTDIFTVGQQSSSHFNNLVVNGAGSGQTLFGNGGTPGTATFSNVTLNTTEKIKGSFNLEGFSGGYLSVPLDGYTLLYSQLKRVTQTIRLSTGMTDNTPTVKPPTGYLLGAWYWINDATGVLGDSIIGSGTVTFTPSTASQRVAILGGDYGTDYPLNAPGTREFHLYTGTVNAGTNLSVEWLYIPYTVDDRQNAPVFTAAAAESMAGTTLPSNVTGSSLTSVGTIATGTWNGTTIGGAYGGTGTAFAAFAGPSSTVKTYTLPNATATILTDNAAVTVAQGGTGTATGSITGTGALTFTAGGTNTDLNLIPNGTGKISQSRSLASGNNVRVFNQNTSSAGFTDILNQNDASKYIRVITGGSATASTFFGVTTANSAGIVADAANLFIGTVTTAPVVFGYNNAEVFRYTNAGISTGAQVTSTLATGTAPLVVASTTRVANLNVATAGTADAVSSGASITSPVVATGVSNNGSGFKHGRVTTGSISAGSTALVTLTWGTTFADTNYTVSAEVEDSTTSSLSLSVVHVESKTAGAVAVRVLNNSVGSLTGTLDVIAVHD